MRKNIIYILKSDISEDVYVKLSTNILALVFSTDFLKSLCVEMTLKTMYMHRYKVAFSMLCGIFNKRFYMYNLLQKLWSNLILLAGINELLLLQQ